MTSKNPNLSNKPQITIIGAGITGLWQAFIFSMRGYPVRLIEKERHPNNQNIPEQSTLTHQHNQTSQYAAGMIAPQCESEKTEPVITKLGHQGLRLWKKYYPHLAQNGTLVVAHRNDQNQLDNFARKTQNYTQCNRAHIQAIEPEIHHQFPNGLFFPEEAHLNPNHAMQFLRDKITKMGGEIKYGEDGTQSKNKHHVNIDCRGISAYTDIPNLRSVCGEALIVSCKQITLKRPIRLLHPKIPVYIVPHGNNLFYIGATMIETKKYNAISVKSTLELLSAAYSVNPAFAEAQIITTISAGRPAFPDNLPRITLNRATHDISQNNNKPIINADITVNGLFRHGFMIAPAIAEITADIIETGNHKQDIIHENYRQRERLHA